MVVQIFVWLILTCSVLQLIYFLYLAWASTTTPKLILGDVVHYLYPVDASLLAGLLDPAVDFELCWNLSPAVSARSSAGACAYIGSCSGAWPTIPRFSPSSITLCAATTIS